MGVIDTSDQSGTASELTRSVPPAVLTTGTNPIRIESINPDISFDIDDFEFSNVRLELTGIEDTQSLSIEEERLVQMTENTRVDAGEQKAGETDIETDFQILHDPDLVLGQNTACVFDIAGPEDLELSGDIEVTVSGENFSFVTSHEDRTTEKSLPSASFLLNGNFVAEETSSVVEQLAANPTDDVVVDGSYPVFKATEDLSNIDIEITSMTNEKDPDLTGALETLLDESEGDGSDNFVEMPTLDIGFTILDKPDIEPDFFTEPVDAERYEETVKKSVKYAQRVAPTPQVNFYRRPADETVPIAASLNRDEDQ